MEFSKMPDESTRKAVDALQDFVKLYEEWDRSRLHWSDLLSLLKDPEQHEAHKAKGTKGEKDHRDREDQERNSDHT